MTNVRRDAKRRGYVSPTEPRPIDHRNKVRPARGTRRGRPPEHDIDFNEPTFLARVKDLQSDPNSENRDRFVDPETKGLMVTIHKSGLISYSAQYTVGDQRPFITLGYYPKMTIQNARYLTKVIQILGEKGVDVQEGLHDRLIRELMEEGTAWRPR